MTYSTDAKATGHKINTWLALVISLALGCRARALGQRAAALGTAATR